MLEMEQQHTQFTVRVLNDDTVGVIRVYRSTPRIVDTTGRVKVIAGGTDRRGMVYLSGMSDLKGKHVNVVVEIYPHGYRHPVPYARFPEPGPFSGWEDMNRIGMHN